MQETQTALRNISLKPSNAERIALFVGELNGNLKLIEKSFSVKIFHKGDEVKITGNEKDIKHASDAILDLYNLTKNNIEISKEAGHLTIQSHFNVSLSKKTEVIDKDIQIFQEGGWHFNNLYSVEKISKKLKTSPHQEFSDERYSSEQIIQKKISNFQDLYNRGHIYQKISIDNFQTTSVYH